MSDRNGDNHGRTALITGASGGFGLEFARLFARDGYNLVLVARSEGKLHHLAAQLQARYGVRVRVLPKDLTDPVVPDAIFAALQQESIVVDVLVNNAGFATYGTFAEIAAQADLEMVAVNVVALTHLTKLFLPGMLERRSGRILNIASTAAFQPGPLMAAYYATKAYVLSLSEALAEEVRGTGVTVTALCPGPSRTGFQQRANMEESRLVKGRQIWMRAPSPASAIVPSCGKTVVVPGLANRVLSWSPRFVPRSWATRFVKNLQARD